MTLNYLHFIVYLCKKNAIPSYVKIYMKTFSASKFIIISISFKDTTYR